MRERRELGPAMPPALPLGVLLLGVQMASGGRGGAIRRARSARAREREVCSGDTREARSGLTAPRLRHLGAAAIKDLRNPVGVREIATGKSLELPVHVIRHTSDCWLGLIQQEVCSTAIAIVRKTNAACVGDDHS